MRTGRIVRRSDGAVLLPRVARAEGVWSRTRGLLGRPPLGPDEGLLIPRCRSVHTLGMRYALDLAFLDATGSVRRIRRRLPPGRVAFCWGASMVLELAAGAAAAAGLAEGMEVAWTE